MFFNHLIDCCLSMRSLLWPAGCASWTHPHTFSPSLGSEAARDRLNHSDKLRSALGLNKKD